MAEPPETGRAARATALAKELRIVVGKLGRRLRMQSAPGALTWSQVQVLGHLDRDGPATTSALARAEGVRPQSMGATVAAMEEALLLRTAPDPKDGRQTLLTLTDLGRRRLKENRLVREDWLASAVQTTFTRAEQDDLARTIELLERLTETP